MQIKILIIYLIIPRRIFADDCSRTENNFARNVPVEFTTQLLITGIREIKMERIFMTFIIEKLFSLHLF